MAKLITLIGNAGKTTLSYYMGNMLATNGRKCLIINTDVDMPIYTLLTSAKKQKDLKSLGVILSSPINSKRTILDNMSTFSNNKNLALICYETGENKYTYPEIQESDVLYFINELKSMIDYIIIDTSRVQNNLDNMFLDMSDFRFCITSADLKGMAYRMAQKKNDVINVLVSLNKNNPIEEIKSTFDNRVKYVLPYQKNLSDIFNGVSIEEVMPGKNYLNTVKLMLKEFCQDE